MFHCAVSPRPTANDIPYTSRANPASFMDRQEVRRSPQPSYVVGPLQSRTCNSPSTFAFTRSSAASSSPSFSSSPYTSSAAESSANSTFVQRQVRTERMGQTTKTTVIETFRNPDGSTKTVQKETTSTGNDHDDIGLVGGLLPPT